MRWTILLATLLAGCVASDNSNAGQPPLATRQVESPPAPVRSPPQSLEQQLLAEDPEHWGTEFERFELFPLPGQVERYAAICDVCYMWGGTAVVFDVFDGHVENILWLPHGGHCMYQLRVIAIEGVDGPLIEAYGMTHMGHGHYYLHRVHPDRIETLIDTSALDFHGGDDVIRGGLLKPSYADVNGDGYRDVTLSGTRDFGWDNSTGTEVWTESEFIRKSFLFDPKSRTYSEDKTRRIGERYQDS